MAEREQIPLRVSPQQKKNWAQYQEELGFGSRESMIRRSVEYFYATQTGGDDELVDEVSTQLDSLNQKLVNLQSEVSEMHADQMEKADIPDIAEEFDYTLSESDVLDTYEGFEEGEEFIDGLNDSLAHKGLYPNDEDDLDYIRAVAVEYTLAGFRIAVHAIRDPVERKRLDDLLEDFREELLSLENHD